MKFIDKGDTVQVQIAEMTRVGAKIFADFEVSKDIFEGFLDHVIAECKKAYTRDELFHH